LFALGILVSSCGDPDNTTKPAQGSGAGPSVDAGGGCTTNAQCAPGMCDTALKRCIECARNADCGPGRSCAFNRCVQPTSCKTSADCPNQACDLGNGRCVPCLTSQDCPPDYACNSELSCAPAPVCQNTLACSSGLVCDRVTNRCLECVGNGDCLPNQHCDKNVCRPICDSDNDCRPLGLLCNRVAGNCVSCLDHNDCEPSRFCDAGLCRVDVCTPGSFTCRDGGLAECNASGSDYGTPEPCPKQQSCSTASGAARCEDQTCVPSTTYCEADGSRVMSCAADGLSSTVKEDCAANAKTCVAASCRTPLCKPRETFCMNNELQVCGAEGDTATRLQACDTSRQYCDAARKTCSPLVCTPNAPVCDLNVAKTCKPDGSGYTGAGTDCSATSQHCTAGTCRTRICQPSVPHCKNGDVYVCSSDGFTEHLYLDCRVDEFCTPGSYSCYPRVCTPGALSCFPDNSAGRCNADGSGSEPGATNCGASGKVCSQGQCVTPVCTPNYYFCRDGNVHLCGSDSINSTLVQTCTASEQCTSSGSTATCALKPIVETFEDGDYTGWTAGGKNTASVVNTVAANSTTRSLRLSGGDGTGYGGLHQLFPAIQPSSISWWVRAEQTNTRSGIFELSTPGEQLVQSYLNEDGQWYLWSGAQAVSTGYTANTWIHFEIKDISWTNRSFYFYVDGAYIGYFGFSGTGTSIGRVDLYQYSGVSYFDEIELR
jgi:hypothetical protein